MDDPIKWYGGAGWILVSLFMLGATLVVEPLTAQGLLALFALGTLGLGVRALRDGARAS